MKRLLLHSAYWLTFSKTTIQIFNFFVTIYIANLLLPSDYALMGIAMVVIGMMQFFTEFGLSEVIVQRKELLKTEINLIFWFAAFIGLLLSISCFFLASPAEVFFQKDGIKEIIRVLSIVLFLHSLSVVPYKLIDRKMKFKLKAIIDLSAKVTSLSGAIAFAHLGFGVWALVYAQIIYVVVITFLSFVFEPFLPWFSLRLSSFNEITGFGLKIICLRALWYFRTQISNIIGGKFLDAQVFGHYTVAFQLSRNLRSIILNVMSVLSVPVLSRYQDDNEKMNRAFLLMVKYLTITTLPIFIGGCMLSKEIITLLLPPKWLPAAPIFSVACLVSIFLMMNAIYENLYIAKGKPHSSVIMNLLMSVALTGSFLWGVQWGVNGLLVAWLIVLPLAFIGWTYFTLRDCQVSLFSYLKNLEPAAIGSLSMVLLLLPLKFILFRDIDSLQRFEMVPHLLFTIIAAALVYLIALYIKDAAIFSIFLSDKEAKTDQ